MRHVLSLVVLVALLGCKKSSSSGFTPPPPATTKPVAVVPEDFKVEINKTNVTLDGSKSYDPVAGAPVPTFLWEQIAGTTVTLISTTDSKPKFTAPGSPDVLSFKLTVTGAQGTDSAIVTVTVKTFVVTGPESWFAGYGKTAVLSPTIAGPVSGGATYLWTGLEPWLKVTGDLVSPTLTVKAPTLPEFQNFPNRVGVLLMERTTQGRLQLKIKVTDGGESDEDFFNFSVGPFADSVANENVALGEPVFLNGGATIPTIPGPTNVTTWAWSGIGPTGAALSFFKPDKSAVVSGTATANAQYVYFVTDQPGTYQLQVTQNKTNPEETTKFIEIISGKYVGVGSLTGTTPDPFKGECAACHAGQLAWLADFANPWKQTGHAHVFERLLDPVDPFYTPSQAKGRWLDAFNFGSDFSIDSRTVGWSRITKPGLPNGGTNGGWAQQAEADGYVFHGSSWDELIRKHPLTAGKSNVQCESCHGPGSEHAGDASNIRKSYDALVCGRCHSQKDDQWEGGVHGSVTSAAFTSASGSGSCNGCHTAQGYVVEMRAQEGVDPHPVLFAVSNVDRPVLPLDDRRGVACQACHEPHKKTVGKPADPSGHDPQLRAFGNVKFRNDGVANAGIAATCYTCHQSRTDTRDNSPDMNVRRAPHDSTAAEMLSATNGIEFAGWTYQSSPHGIPSKFIPLGKTENRQCLTCHVDVAPAKGEYGYNAIGGHTFRMSQGDGTSSISDSNYGAGATTAGTRTFNLTAPTAIATFLKKAYTGDILVLTGGSDAGSYVVDNVDTSHQVSVLATSGFTSFNGTTPPTSWSLTSVPKYNIAACSQCHPTGLTFEVGARADYDGDTNKLSVQEEIAGLRSKLQTAIEAGVSALVTKPVTLLVDHGRIKYKITATSAIRTFPGPGVTASDNPDISWSSLSPADQATWITHYKAAYNWAFVGNDGSGGVHNTGYAVNLLQSAYKAVTGSDAGSPFVPFP